MIRVLVICTGNSCRSQMAEGWLRHFGKGEIEATSAGTHPAFVHPLAIQVMAEAGIDIRSHYSKSVDDVIGKEFDYVVTVCDSAHEECPVFPGRHIAIHMPFEDPSSLLGPTEQKVAAFRKTRDVIGEAMKVLSSSVLRDDPQRKRGHTPVQPPNKISQAPGTKD